MIKSRQYPTDWQEQIQEWSRRVTLRRDFDLKFSGIHLTEINFGYKWTIRHRCICMWSWTEILAFSYRPRARTVLIPLRMNTEICQLGEGHSLCPWECRLSVGKPFLRTPRKCCQQETRASWSCRLQCTFSSSQSVPSQNKVLGDFKPNICISHYHFCDGRSSF